MSSNEWIRVGRAAVRNAGCALALLLAVAPVCAHEVNEAVPAELSECVARCMSVDKSKRYDSMEQLREEFKRFLPAEV